MNKHMPASGSDAKCDKIMHRLFS